MLSSFASLCREIVGHFLLMISLDLLMLLLVLVPDFGRRGCPGFVAFFGCWMISSASLLLELRVSLGIFRLTLPF